MSIRALIVDDEQKARNVLNALLTDNFSDVEVVDQVEDVPTAVRSINRHKPDVVFLDVEMPGYNGFQLLDFFDKIDFNIIFTTAYSEYAIQAFQVSAVDYLLKPLQIEQLELAIEKLKGKSVEQNREVFDNLKENIANNSIRKIALPTSSGILFVKVEDIVYLKAEGSYTNFYMSNGKQVLVSRKIKEYEAALSNENRFYRPHRSYVINADRITEYVKADGGSVVLDNGDSIPISREIKDEFLNYLGMR